METLEESLQQRYSPNGICFGCGPKNDKGLRIRSRIEGDLIVADFIPEEYQHSFEGYVSGGILSTILDCHSNWAGAYYIMKKRGVESIPATVTAEYTVTFLRPTPIKGTLRLKARAINVSDNRAEIQTTVEVDGVVTAKATGTFVAVKEGHPAYGRWG